MLFDIKAVPGDNRGLLVMLLKFGGANLQLLAGGLDPAEWQPADKGHNHRRHALEPKLCADRDG